MKKHIADFRIALLVALIGFGAGAPVELRADENVLDIANVPVFLGSQPKPNVMLTVRNFIQRESDSGSEQITYLYQPAFLDENGESEPEQQLPLFDPTNPFTRTHRSTRNSLFYDPTQDYRPWIRADGSRFPDADSSAARLHPVFATAEGFSDFTPVQTFDLESLQTHGRWAVFNASDVIEENRQFWPITFLTYDGGDVESPFSYTVYQIQGNQAFRAQNADATLQPIEGFSWPNGITRTVEEEKQNFANWFVYHRSVLQATTAAMTEALFEAAQGFRVGFGLSDPKSLLDSFYEEVPDAVDGVDIDHVWDGVRDFESPAVRSALFQRLYELINVSALFNTIVDPMMSVGEYFSRQDERGPWSSTPGQAGGGFSACRKSFHLMVGNPARKLPNDSGPGNADNTPGPVIQGPDNQEFQYQPGPPFADSTGDTPADVAMNYWKRDLLPNVANQVVPTARNPAFWQNLSTFFVSVGGQSNIDPDAAFAAAEDGASIDWPEPTSIAAPDRSDTMVHTVLNGRGEYIEADSVSEVVEPLKQVLREISARASAVGGVSVSATRLTQDTVAYASEFNSTGWTGELRAIDLTNQSTEWEASVDLNARAPSSRTILTYDGSGTYFDTGMSSSLKALIDSDPARADDIIRYVRGEPVDGFRSRDNILGDIVSSRPTFVGPTNEGWASLGGSAGAAYSGFVDDKSEETDAVYIGANDGMLHAFDAETGEELFGYVPRAVLPKLGALTDDPYAHQFYVDGQQTVRDAWDGSQWRRVLVGTLGAGGRGVYALDVTDPNSPEVLWEVSSDDDLGFVFGEPLITRLGESGTGNWKALFGNGYNSPNGDSILYSVDLFSGSVSKVTVESGGGGLSAPELLLDPASRKFAVRVYAGDLDGTVWRVDFDNSGSPSLKYSSGLFTADDNRPITAAPGLAASPSGGLVVYVGTGKLIETDDRQGASNLEFVYALRDRESALGNNPDLGSVSMSSSGNERELIGSAGEDGWVLQLTVTDDSTGERVLNQPRIIFGQVIFSTFEPVTDECTPGGTQRLYVLDAITGGGELDDVCANCGGIEIGTGVPLAPPVVITPPELGDNTNVEPDDPTDPFAPPDQGELPGGDTVGSVGAWCNSLSSIDGNANTLPLGELCDGRQSWRQVR